MRIIILIVCSWVLFSSGIVPPSQDGRFRIEGVVDSSLDGNRAVLHVRDAHSQVVSSDTSVIEQGKFIFEGDENMDCISSVVVEDRYGIYAGASWGLLLESGVISLSYKDGKPQIEGTPLNDIFMEHMLSCLKFTADMSKFEMNTDGNSISVNINSELGKLHYLLGESMINFMAQNFSSPLGKAYLMIYSDIGAFSLNIYIFNSGKPLDEIFYFVDDQTRSHPRFVSYMEALKKSMQSYPLTGKQINDYTLSLPDGTTKQLSDYLGDKDYVFLEFWASWCSPCLATIPSLKEIYAEYSDRLEIISISLDAEKSDWIKALETQNMPWLHLADFNGFDSIIAKEMGVTAIPFGVLLDKQGVVIGRVGPNSLQNIMKRASNKAL